MPDIKQKIGRLCLSVLFILFIITGTVTAQVNEFFDDNDENKIRSYIYKNTPQGDLKIYIHFPNEWRQLDKRPVIVFFFGGGWTKGKVDQFMPQANYLTQRGMISARADYRVRNRHGTLAPKCVEDGKSAVRWLRVNADSLGIDPDHIVASGGSAGGHVAACTFMVEGFDAVNENTAISSKPNMLILFNPVLDATAGKRVARMGSPETAKLLSPNFYLKKDTPPTLLFYGKQDSLLEHGKIYVKKAIEIGFTAELFIAEGVGHGFFNKDPWLSQTLYLADLFLVKNGYLDGEPNLSPDGKIIMKKFIPCREDKKSGNK